MVLKFVDGFIFCYKDSKLLYYMNKTLLWRGVYIVDAVDSLENNLQACTCARHLSSFNLFNILWNNLKFI